MEENQVAPEATTQIPAPVPAETPPEVAEPEPEVPSEETVEDDPRDKSLKKMERRINRLTEARYQEAARAQQAAEEAEQLRQRLAQYEQPQEKQQQVDPVQLASEIASIREVTAKSNQIVSEGRKRFGAEFDKAISTVIDEAGALVKPISPGASIGKPTELGRAILSADDPAAVLNYLGSNPEVASELSGLDAIQAARKVARIEIELARPKEPKQSNAPKPVSPVKNATRDDGGLSDELSAQEWQRRFYKARREGSSF